MHERGIDISGQQAKGLRQFLGKDQQLVMHGVVDGDELHVKVDGGKRSYRRPMYAGNAYGWLEIATPVHVVSVRQTEFPAAQPSGGASPLENATRAAEDAAAAQAPAPATSEPTPAA